ncbi:MAG TPA: YdcH family protein [Acetobacteraceae bacterium]|nr:YdcH family protein [Acetobacteraceae bacterium]
MNLQARLESLKERHAALESQILDEDQRPRPDSDTLMRLKLEKLHVKEEIERLRQQVQVA